MRKLVSLVLATAAMVAAAATSQETAPLLPNHRSQQLSLLVRAGLAQAHVGAFDAELDLVRAGLGIGWGKFGIVASTGWGEIAPSGWGGDYMFQLTTTPLEFDITYGLAPGRRLSQPVLYVHGEYNPSGVLYHLHGGGVSIGALWTFWAVSGGVQATWRRSIFGEDQTGRTYRDFYSVGVTLDLGGWWPVALQTARD